MLVNQKTKFPTRKLLAVIVSGAIIGGVQAGLQFVWPDHPFMVLLEQADIWIQAGVMALSGYLVRERSE